MGWAGCQKSSLLARHPCVTCLGWQGSACRKQTSLLLLERGLCLPCLYWRGLRNALLGTLAGSCCLTLCWKQNGATGIAVLH